MKFLIFSKFPVIYLYLCIFLDFLYLSYFQVLPYFLYSQVFYIFFTIMLFMFYILNLPYLFLQVFCQENAISAGLYYGAEECVSHAGILKEAAIHFTHSNDNLKSMRSVNWSLFGEEIHGALFDFLESKPRSRIPPCT